jgi:hypothetical protein
MTDRELMQMALDALEAQFYTDGRTIKALRERLAQPEPEPVAWMVKFQGSNKGWQLQLLPHRVHPESPLAKNALNLTEQPLYTVPPKREWVGLTDEERKDIELGIEVFDMSVEDILKEAEAKLKEKNT